MLTVMHVAEGLASVVDAKSCGKAQGTHFKVDYLADLGVKERLPVWAEIGLGLLQEVNS